MPIQTRNTIRGWLLRGMKPLAAQFSDWLDSFVHKNDNIAMASIIGLNDTLATLATINQVKGLYRGQIVLNADGYYDMPLGMLIEDIIVDGDTGMPAFSIGKTNNAADILPAIEITNAYAEPVGVKIYAKAARRIYFNGITGTVNLIFIINTI